MTSVIIVGVQNHAYQIHEHVARTALTNKKLDRKVRCKSWTNAYSQKACPNTEEESTGYRSTQVS